MSAYLDSIFRESANAGNVLFLVLNDGYRLDAETPPVRWFLELLVVTGPVSTIGGSSCSAVVLSDTDGESKTLRTS